MNQDTSRTKLISVTPDAENLIAYCARVSNPSNQNNENIEGLLRYCARNGHWSVFEMANMVVEINTTRAIAPQFLRHRSFFFQEFSLRYSAALGIELPEVRRQDTKNRQNSIDDLPVETKAWFEEEASKLFQQSQDFYSLALEKGVAKECARAILPMNTKSRFYMNGTIRSWIHYLDLRTGNGTQLEHKQIADEIKEVHFKENFPIIYDAMWGEL